MLDLKIKSGSLRTEFQAPFCQKNVIVFEPILSMLGLVKLFLVNRTFISFIRTSCRKFNHSF